jgi:DNA-directed RNA polymerase subunit RPC12/RpoP
MSEIKNKCSSCGREFKNSKRNNDLRGNCCISCGTKVTFMDWWRNLNRSKKRSAYGEAKMKKLYDIILQRWGIDMLSPVQQKYNNSKYETEYAK